MFYRICQVIVLALPSNDNLPDESIYNENLGTYLDGSSVSVPYITAEFWASDYEKYQNFILGDKTLFYGRSANDANRSQNYFNGPLTPNTRYTVFQRFLSREVSLRMVHFRYINLDAAELFGGKIFPDLKDYFV